LSNVFTECPFDGGYDISFGTSERGQPLRTVLKQNGLSDTDHPPNFQHVVVVFGGVAGLETAAKNDPELQKMSITGKNVSELFDHWVNVLPGQGSRTIRTEEAVWLGLMGLRTLVGNLAGTR
jgi:predicted SPOUT superfamily RNA methylase MTH1